MYCSCNREVFCHIRLAWPWKVSHSRHPDPVVGIHLHLQDVTGTARGHTHRVHVTAKSQEWSWDSQRADGFISPWSPGDGVMPHEASVHAMLCLTERTFSWDIQEIFSWSLQIRELAMLSAWMRRHGGEEGKVWAFPCEDSAVNKPVSQADRG